MNPSSYNQTMSPIESELDSTLQRIATRWWLHRAIETIGLGIVIGSGVGLILVPLFAWQSASSWQLSVGILFLSTIAGATIALRQRPSTMRAAMEADRQWQLDELLVSAASMLLSPRREGVDPSMRDVVLSLASRDLATRNLSGLILHRFTRRAWAGMSSFPVLLILLTGICSHPIVLRAAAEARGKIAATAGSSERLVIPPGEQSDGRNSRASGESSDASEREDDAAATSRDARPSSGDATRNGSGNAGGRTDDARMTDARYIALNAQLPTTGQPTGGDGASVTGSSGDGKSGRIASVRSVPPPWERRDWRDQQARAIQSLQQTPPPASYRDLIRDYFSR